MSVAHKVEVAVIGAGVIGLAVSRQLAMMGKEVILIERASSIGSGTSSRNSEVIHAGLYYPPNYLKTKLCIQGRRLLYDYCQTKCIPHKAIGKIIVATTESQCEVDLPSILNRAKSNGVHDLKLLSVEDVSQFEPKLLGSNCKGGIYSPSTGIVDSHAFMMGLLADAEEHGATLALHSEVQNGRPADSGGIVLQVADMELQCENVVNCAGLFAGHVSNRIVKFDKSKNDVNPNCLTRNQPRQYFAKGNYYKLEGQKSPFSHLVYPIPEPGGLGVHATLDLAGNCRFGPDVEWVDMDVMDPDDIDMTVDINRSDKFYDQIRKYWPGLQDGGLVPDYAGIRPKIGHPDLADESFSIHADFVIEGPDDHGIKGLVNMFGMESPGLTSSMAVAEQTAQMLR